MENIYKSADSASRLARLKIIRTEFTRVNDVSIRYAATFAGQTGSTLARSRIVFKQEGSDGGGTDNVGVGKDASLMADAFLRG